MLKICILLINFYQKYLSFDSGVLAVLAPSGACKYSPSCSEFTKQKIMEFGMVKGSLLGIKRIWSCK